MHGFSRGLDSCVRTIPAELAGELATPARLRPGRELFITSSKKHLTGQRRFPYRSYKASRSGARQGRLSTFA